MKIDSQVLGLCADGEKFFTSFSFDMDDFIGDGIWWLQIYDCDKMLICDKPFASSRDILDREKVREIIKEEFCHI